MTDGQFKIQLDRLKIAFGEKPFDHQRLYLIRDSLRHLSYEQFERMVDRFIREKKPNDPPLPKDFAEIAKIEGGQKRKIALGEYYPQELAECWDCGDSGFIRLVRNEDYDEWAKWDRGSAPCHCDKGRQVSQNKKHNLGLQFNETWKKSYSVLPCYTAQQPKKSVEDDIPF